MESGQSRPAAPSLLFEPTPTAIESSQLTAFQRAGRRTLGVALDDWTKMHDFSVRRFRDFWKLFVEWAPIDLEGDTDTVCEGDGVENATFFPRARLSLVAHLIRCDGPADDARVAIVALDERGGREELTRAELRERVLRVARGLEAMAIGPGDRLCAVASNTAPTVIACLGALAIGAVWSSLSPDIGFEGIVDRFEQVRPRVLLYDATFLHQGRVHDAAAKIAKLVDAIPSIETSVALRGPVHPQVRASCRHDATSLAQIEQIGADAPGPRAPDELPRFDFNRPAYVLFSSGTTDRPKCIVHGAGGTLLEHHKEHRLHCDLGAGDRLYFHSTTAWMMWNWVVSALACKTCIVLYEGAPSYPEPDSLWKIASREGVTVFGTSPTFLQACKDCGLTPAKIGLPALRAVQSTGSVLPEDLFHWVRASVGPVAVQSISGGTDILGCFLLGNPNLPVFAGELQCKSLGLDVDVDPMDSPPEVLARGAVGYGELVCKTPFPSRPLGFLADPDGRRFHDAYFGRNGGDWHHGDWLELSPTGGGRIHGRCDGVLNIRGVRIGPAEIYRAIEHCAERAIAGALAIELLEEGGHASLVLLVVPREGQTFDPAVRRRLASDIVARTSRAHAPSLIVAVSDLPTTHSGKRSERAAADAVNGRPIRNAAALRNPDCLEEIRQAVAEARASQTVCTEGGVRADGSTLEKVRALWQEVLQVAVGNDDSFFDLGGQSLAGLVLLGRIRGVFGIALPASALVHETPTIATMALAIEKRGFERTSSIVPLGGPRRGRAAYWVPGGGGLSLLMFHEISLRLGRHRPIFGFEYDVRSGRENESLPDIARRYVHDLRSHDPEGPYVLLGFSNGAWTAFEMTRQIEEDGGHVALLVVFDTPVPIQLGPLAQARAAAHRARYHLAHLQALPPRSMLEYAAGVAQVAATRLRRAIGPVGLRGATGDLTATGLPADLATVDRHNRRKTSQYSGRDHTAIAAPIALLLATRGSRAALPPDLDGRYGWQRLTRSRFDVARVNASHLSMLRDPDMGEVAEQLEEILRALPGSAELD